MCLMRGSIRSLVLSNIFGLCGLGYLDTQDLLSLILLWTIDIDAILSSYHVILTMILVISLLSNNVGYLAMEAFIFCLVSICAYQQ